MIVVLFDSMIASAVCSSNSSVGCSDGFFSGDGGGIVVVIVICGERRPTLVAQ
jgi:hypothetical protein